MSDAGDTIIKKDKKRPFIKKVLPRSLLGRSLLILVTPILLIQLVSAYIFLDNHWQKILDRLAYAVAGEISVMVQAIEDDSSLETIDRIQNYVSKSLDLQMRFEKGERLKNLKTKNHAIWEAIVADTLASHLHQQITSPYKIHADFENKWVNVSVQLDKGVLHVSLPERRLFSSSGYIFLIWMFGTSFLLFAVAVLFMRNQIRPIRRLAVAADWFGRGRDVQKFKLEGATEVRQAGQAFLDMRRRIKRQVSQRTIMLAGVSHDLRTPLTRMKLQLEMMPKSEDAQAMKDDISHMQKMIDGYLDFARGDEGEPIAQVSLNAVMRQIKDKFERQSVEIELNTEDGDIQLPLRVTGFERCLSNIINNACKYGTKVWINVRKSKDERAEIIIEDNGSGIDEHEYEDVFKPFYRIDPSRTDADGSVGLGLSIAMDVIHGHGGRIWLDKSEHGGLKVLMRMPL